MVLYAGSRAHVKRSGGYVNVLNNEGDARVRAAYPLERLRSVKRRYDPDNFFHLNENITP